MPDLAHAQGALEHQNGYEHAQVASQAELHLWPVLPPGSPQNAHRGLLHWRGLRK